MLVAALAVIGLVWWAIAAMTGGSPEAAPAESTPPPAVVQTAAPTTEPAATPTATPTPTGPAACTDADVDVAAAVDAGEYAPEAQPQLSLTLTNVGQQPCTLDVGTATQVYTITSGADTIWTSTDCQTDPVNDVVSLAPGQSLQSPPVTWVRERSTPDTCEGERPAAVGGGASYQLVASIGGFTSAPAGFVLL